MQLFRTALAVGLVAAATASFSTQKVEAAPVDVDIMFVIDQSGSMSNEFATLGASITTFVNALNASADVNSVAAGLVTYEDASQGPGVSCFGGPCLDLAQAITTNVSDLSSALTTASVNTFGGTEDALAAVDSVLPGGSLFGTAAWRNNTIKSVVLITDEDADDGFTYSNSFGVGYAALGAKLDDVNYLNNIITESNLFSTYEDAARPNNTPQQALFDLDDFTGPGADPNAFLLQFANAKLQEITTGGTPTGGSTAVPLPAAGWMLLAGLGGMAAMRRKKKAA